MPLLSPDHLLEQAERLITPSGGGASRQVDLRRAISNAYYAVFHAILTDAADDFVGKTHRMSDRYALLYRSVNHRALVRLCEDVKKSSLPAKYTKYAPSGGFGNELAILSNAVVELQETRHLADYDPRFRATASDAVNAIASSRAALACLKRANRAQRKAFLSLLVFAPR